ncbi:hypothetical protein RJG79_08205 [Mycoplasmatota bacterium WC44]
MIKIAMPVDDSMTQINQEIRDNHLEWFSKYRTDFENLKEQENFGYNIEDFLFGDYNKMCQIIKDIGEITDVVRRESYQKVFNYTNFASRTKEWDTYKFIEKLNIKVCPYCNMEDLILMEKGNRSFKPHLDHYFNKNKYPYFSVSLYNLIPSCSDCNTKFKTTKDFYKTESIYPYLEQYGTDGNFNVSNISLEKLISMKPISETDIKVDLVINENSSYYKKILYSSNTFLIEERYNNQKSFIANILNNIRFYSSSYLESIKKDLGLPEIEEIKRSLIMLPPKDEELYNNKFSKLCCDIAKQYKLL